jgi:hypothetical protein
VQFSAEADTLPVVPAAVLDPDFCTEPDLLQLIEREDDVEYINVENVLEQSGEQLEGDDSPGSASVLPVHMRCAAHTLNLVATADADKALKDTAFKNACRKAMAKAQGLWNAQSRSTQFADIIEEEFERRLVVPNATRWNSVYDSIMVLNTLLEKKR